MAHNAALRARTGALNASRYHALHFRGPGTDLRVGLSDGHLWLGGCETAKNGVTCNPNIPTEEVFTTPHMLRVDGTVRSTKPLSYGGTLIQDIQVRFEGGQHHRRPGPHRAGGAAKGAGHRRGRAPAGGGGAGAQLLPHLRQRPAVPEHAV